VELLIVKVVAVSVKVALPPVPSANEIVFPLTEYERVPNPEYEHVTSVVVKDSVLPEPVQEPTSEALPVPVPVFVPVSVHVQLVGVSQAINTNPKTNKTPRAKTHLFFIFKNRPFI
jgi:hypothetical protein